MATSQRSIAIGSFPDHLQADRAIDELLNAGFRSDQIGAAGRYEEGTVVAAEEPDTHAGTGAAKGALAGFGVGALAGLGVLSGVIPVIGPAIAAGTMGVILSNAAAGAGIAGLVGALVGAGVPEHEAEYYHGEFEKGRTIVTVNAGDRYAEADAILSRLGASRSSL